MGTVIQTQGIGFASGQFVSEVEDFRAAIDDPTVNFDAKKRAYDAILRHAAMLDPQEAGFWRAGVALKNALCAWLDFRPLMGN